MRAFQFRLQAVLTLREQAKQAAQRRCAQAYLVVESARVRLQSAEAAIVAADELRRARLVAGIRAGELQQMRDHAVLLNSRRMQLTRELTEAWKQAESARRELVIAAQRQEGLDRLRARQQQVFNYESARAEQKLLDEMCRHGPVLSQAGSSAPQGGS